MILTTSQTRRTKRGGCKKAHFNPSPIKTRCAWWRMVKTPFFSVGAKLSLLQRREVSM